jgi:antitoxin (DNA-binding transcriptional repressor) of toxin-antitoxin stability system
LDGNPNGSETRIRDITAFEAEGKLGQLFDQGEAGEVILITRGGRIVARLMPPAPSFNRERAREAAPRIRESRKGVTPGDVALDQRKKSL